jgi:hypothetical protein
VNVNDKTQLLRSVFSKNRTEELGYDVWRHFVIPPFYDRPDLKAARKPRVIVGGRGCGKTMLLRYLSHQSTFSPSRAIIPEEAFEHVGLYWRADTQFACLMDKRGIEPDVWQTAFNHWTALVLAIEILRSLSSIEGSRQEILTPEQTRKLDFSRLRAFDDFPPSREDLLVALEQRLWKFQTWVNNARTMPPPIFLPGRDFLLALIQSVRSQLPPLSDTTYFAYVDEYENLPTYQQRVINTWLKHSEEPLIFNLAVKRHGIQTNETVGNEFIADIHDYRTHDLDDYLEDDFEVFAAEVLFLQLSMAGIPASPSPVSDEVLRDPAKLPDRRRTEYQKKVVQSAESLFPDVTEADLATEVFQDDALSQTLRRRIELALRKRGNSSSLDRFFRPQIPSASTIAPALLNRDSLKPDEIAEEMDKLERGQDNRFLGKTDWVHNNFIGCLLLLYDPYSRACPFYAGFHTFCHLARGSLRHLLELCHKSIYQASVDLDLLNWPLAPQEQAEATRLASTAFLGEVRSFGRLGNRLHSFVMRLGTLFKLAHQRPTQSEPEQTHFSVSTGREQLTQEDKDFLLEATKWSVLFEEKGTKKKEPYVPEDTEYVLNPIYAPYFHISYRKKRKVELNTSELICLIRGSYAEVTALLSKFSRMWDVEPRQVVPTLFGGAERSED